MIICFDYFWIIAIIVWLFLLILNYRRLFLIRLFSIIVYYTFVGTHLVPFDQSRPYLKCFAHLMIYYIVYSIVYYYYYYYIIIISILITPITIIIIIVLWLLLNVCNPRAHRSKSTLARWLEVSLSSYPIDGMTIDIIIIIIYGILLLYYYYYYF